MQQRLLTGIILFVFPFISFSQKQILDSSFGVNGQAVLDIRRDYPNAMIFQTNNKILIAGNDDTAIRVMRYFPGGKPDSSFGKNGITTIQYNNTIEKYPSLCIQANGKIIITASFYSGDTTYLAIIRLNTKGLPDAAFGKNSLQLIPIYNSSNLFVTSCLTQPDDKILIAHSYFNGLNYDFCVRRFLTNGAIDHSFANNGSRIVDFSGRDDKAYKIALQTNGKIIVAGSTSVNNKFNDAFALLRLKKNGAADSLFGKKGKAIIDFGTSRDEALDVLIDTKDRIIAAGYAHDGATHTDVFGLARLKASGEPDYSFGDSGKVKTLFPNIHHNQVNNILLLPSNNILAVGITDSSHAVSAVTSARYKTNGRLDSVYGQNGIVITEFKNLHEDFGRAKNVSALRQNNKTIVLCNLNFDYLLFRYKSAQNFLKTILSNNLANAATPVQNTISNPLIKASPNPVESTLHITGLETNTKLSIINASGKIVSETNTSSNIYTWNIQNLPAGTYFLIAFQNNKMITTIKFVKQ